MGSARWAVSDVVAADPDTVFAWMSDFRKDDHNSPAYLRGAGIDPNKKRKPSQRTILSREGNVLRIRDQWDGSTWEQTVTLDPERRTLRIQGGFGYDATWSATPEAAGTRVRVEGQMGKGFLGSFLKLFERATQRSMEKDFRGHMGDLREAVTR